MEPELFLAGSRSNPHGDWPEPREPLEPRFFVDVTHLLHRGLVSPTSLRISGQTPACAEGLHALISMPHAGYASVDMFGGERADERFKGGTTV